MSDTSCGWNDGCERTALDDNTLCEEHIAEARRLRAIKVQGWRDAEDERLEKYAFILSTFDSAYKAGVAGVLAIGGDVTGDSEVVVGHSRTNSQVYNVLMGTTKLSRLSIPGWQSPSYVKGTINRLVEGLSNEAALVFATEYNAVLDAAEVANTKAIVA